MATKKRFRINEAIAAQDAAKCNTRSEFNDKYSGSWRYLSNRKLLDKYCSHMTGNVQWTTKMCVDLALTCKTRGEFKKKHHNAYLHMSHKKLHDQCYAHMGPARVPGRKKDTTQADIQDNCEHQFLWRGRNQVGKLYKCTKCKLIRVVKKTQADLIADLIKSKIARQ